MVPHVLLDMYWVWHGAFGLIVFTTVAVRHLANHPRTVQKLRVHKAAEGRAMSLCLEHDLYVHARCNLHELTAELAQTRNPLTRREWKFNNQGEITASPVVRAVDLMFGDV